MELRHLRYFVAIAETESFRRAADRLHVSQSPLSRQMQQLEDEIGVELFAPAGRGVKLTPAGHAFLDKTRAALSAVDAAVEASKATAEGRIGTVRIAFEGGSSLSGPLAAVIARFRKQQPRIKIELVTMESSAQWEALRRGEISIAYGRYVPGDVSFQSVVLARQRMGIIVAKDHRLATKATIRVKDLDGFPVLIDPRKSNPRLYDDIIAAVRSRGVVLDLEEIVDGEALLMLVASGDGLTFSPENVWPVLAVGFLTAVWRPVVDLGIEMRDIAMWRDEDARSPLVAPLVAIVREIASELPRPRKRSPRR